MTVADETATELIAQLRQMNEKLDRIDTVLDTLQHRVESLEDIREDMWPMIQGASHQITRKLHELEQSGALGFVTEGAKMAEVVATSFTQEDVRLLGQNVVHILQTVRGLTQPEVLDIADRAAVALKDTEHHPEKKIGLFRALRDPEIRRGMTLMLGVIKELGADPANGKNVAAPVAGEDN